MISQQLRQRLEQRLSPQQIQYLKLLQQPLLTLEQSIKQELEINPFLEELEEETIELQPTEDTPAENKESGESEEAEEKEPEVDSSEEDFDNDDYEDDSFGYKSGETWNGDKEDIDIPIEDHISLAGKLREQLHLLELSAEEHTLCEEIIGNIDDDGYLRQELPDILASLQSPITLEQAEHILQKIQRLDPPGIGARNLRECLLAQLHVRNFDPVKKELAINILEHCFEDFVNKRFEKILERFSISIDDYKEVDKLIHKLNPKPGGGEDVEERLTIVPDFIVRQDNDELIVEPTSSSVLTVRLNKKYLELLSQKDKTTKEEKEFIKQRLEAAKTFIQCIQQRQNTLLDVMKAIVIKQKDFFETGEHLKPLTNRSIAELVGFDESTVSRAIHGKYVQTAYGIYALKHFFSSKVQQSNGEEISNKEARLRIKKLIEHEDKSDPLSDDAIAKILSEQGLPLARRTVAKYREQMEIPVARLRRQI